MALFFVGIMGTLDIYSLVFTCLFLIFFIVSYFVVLASRLEQLFKQGSTWQIRVAQVIISFLISYGLASGVLALLKSMQF